MYNHPGLDNLYGAAKESGMLIWTSTYVTELV